MILYLGASSLVQLYVRESHSELLQCWVRVAEIVATCRIAYMEIVSALNRRLKEGDLSKDDYDAIVKSFSNDWGNFAKVDFDDVDAGNLAERYGLTRFGAIHLSAAKLIMTGYKKCKPDLESTGNRTLGMTLFFSSEDTVLCDAAAGEGLKVLPLM